YLDNPLTEDNKLIISDRRISINGSISTKMANEITTKIDYFNNKDKSKPIFIVIDKSPGGSAMAGYLILKAMKGSTAPIYVVLREYAASMAAIILTLADKSFAYAHSTILHHQPLSWNVGNLTEQREKLKRLEAWWTEFGGATAKKMGITLEEFQKEMYKNNSKGDWEELAVNAQKLKWVNHIVDTISDTSVLEEPQKVEPKEPSILSLLNFEETINAKGEVVVYLPRLSPADSYLIHNPDGYYQFR
ncbi:MAG: ATP-dependent Clp protease proteolytic subunit, partial [uncultured Sulfurovum sp.]